MSRVQDSYRVTDLLSKTMIRPNQLLPPYGDILMFHSSSVHLIPLTKCFPVRSKLLVRGHENRLYLIGLTMHL